MVLVRKDMRETLSLLEPYAALAFSVGGGLYRMLGTPRLPERLRS